jgi:hypothetical protein
MFLGKAIVKCLSQTHQLIKSLFDLRHRVVPRPLGILVSQFDQDLRQPTDRAHDLGW